MELSEEQIEKFKKIHEPLGGLKEYSEEQIREIANEVANFYYTLWEINKRIKKTKK